MLNDLDRFHLVMDVIDRVPGLGERAAALRQEMVDARLRAPRLHARARRRPARGARLDLAGREPRRQGQRPDACESSSSTPARAASSSRCSTSDDATLAARELDAPERAARRRARCATALDGGLGEADARRPPDRPRRRALPRSRCVIDADVEAALRELDRAGAAAPAEVAGGARRGQRGAAATCRRWRASTPPFTRRCRRRPRPTRCRRRGASAGGCAATASTASRTPGSRGARRELLGRRRRGAAHRQLPPRRRRLAVRDRGRALGRHDDGLHAARGSGDGDALGQRRPGHAAVAAGARAADSRRELADALEHQLGTARARAAPADMREVLRPRRSGDERAGPGARGLRHRLRAGIAAMAAALGGLDALVFTGGVGERSARIRASWPSRGWLPRRAARRGAQPPAARGPIRSRAKVHLWPRSS